MISESVQSKITSGVNAVTVLVGAAMTSTVFFIGNAALQHFHESAVRHQRRSRRHVLQLSINPVVQDSFFGVFKSPPLDSAGGPLESIFLVSLTLT